MTVLKKRLVVGACALMAIIGVVALWYGSHPIAVAFAWLDIHSGMVREETRIGGIAVSRREAGTAMARLFEKHGVVSSEQEWRLVSLEPQGAVGYYEVKPDGRLLVFGKQFASALEAFELTDQQKSVAVENYAALMRSGDVDAVEAALDELHQWAVDPDTGTPVLLKSSAGTKGASRVRRMGGGKRTYRRDD